MRDSDRRSYLVATLGEELYCSFYSHGGPVPSRWGEPGPVYADPELTAAMSRANTGRGSWEPGWTIQRILGDVALAATSRLRARVPLDDCRARDGAVAPGAAVSVRLPKELPSISPGFYTAVGDAPAPPAAEAGFVRAYWNVDRDGAPALVGALTSRLNRERVPFRLKVADHPLRLDRCDAAVLYVRADGFGSLRGMLEDAGVALAAHLRPRIPVFTLELVPGVGLAEDQGGADSFGERRCALLADGIVSACERGDGHGDAGVDAVAARFAEAGVQLDAPYLDQLLAGRHVL